MKKTLKLFPFILFLFGLILFTGCTENVVTENIVDGTVSIAISYPENEGYTYTVSENNLVKSSELKKEAGDFILTFKIDSATIGYFFAGDFEAIKKRRADNYEVSDVSVSNAMGFGYYKSSTDQYIIVLPIDESRTFEICVEPKERFKDVTGKKIYDRDYIADIIKSVTITKQ